MSPMEPPEESPFSKILVIGALALLLVVICVCGYVIYGFAVQPPDPDLAAVTPTPEATPTLQPTPTSTTQPTLQTSPTPEATPTSRPVYQFDTQITKGIKVVTPGISGNFVVYDEIVGKDNYSVHIFNTVSLIDDVIATGNVRSYGCIGNGKVGLLYGDDNRIMLYDIESHGQVLATPQKLIPRKYPSIFADKLIYTANDGAYNPTTGWLDIFSLYEFEFAYNNYNLWANPAQEPHEPRGYGSYVTWWYINGDNREIVLFKHDSSPLVTKVISPAGVSSDHPRIYGNRVVYHSNVGGIDHIYFYEISAGITRKVTDLGKQYNADVYENKIVYDDYRDNDWNIYVYDPTTGQEQQLTNEPHDQMAPQVYGSNIIYIDNRNYGPNEPSWDLYIMQA